MNCLYDAKFPLLRISARHGAEVLVCRDHIEEGISRLLEQDGRSGLHIEAVFQDGMSVPFSKWDEWLDETWRPQRVAQ